MPYLVAVEFDQMCKQELISLGFMENKFFFRYVSNSSEPDIRNVEDGKIFGMDKQYIPLQFATNCVCPTAKRDNTIQIIFQPRKGSEGKLIEMGFVFGNFMSKRITSNVEYGMSEFKRMSNRPTRYVATDFWGVGIE